MKEIIKKLVNKENLSFEEVQQIVKRVVKSEVTEAQLGAFLVAITNKGATKEEFFAFASSMREFSHRVIIDKYVVDSCGTGADLARTINVSTASAIIASACGVNVLKQTNSAITSKCGSSDLLMELDIGISRIAQDAKRQFSKHNIAFIHSPYFNDFASVNNPIRQQLGIKTIFNYLGPLINPAFPNAQLLGVSSFEMCEKIIYALQQLGTDRALVVNGLEPNIDEISICSKTAVYELKDDKIFNYEVEPEDFGFKTQNICEIQGSAGCDNAKTIKKIFNNEEHGAKKEIILMNAGAMIYLAGLSKDMFEGTKIAQNVLESGLAYEKLLNLQGVKEKCC